MSMISSYRTSYASGPRHLRPDVEDPPSFMPPYQSGTPEEEEELALLQRLEQQMLEQHEVGEPSQPSEEDDDEADDPPQAEDDDAADWPPAGQEPHERPPAKDEPPPHSWHPSMDEGDAEEPEGKMPTQSRLPPPPTAEQEMDEAHELAAENALPPSRASLPPPLTEVPPRLAPEHSVEKEPAAPDRATWFRQQAVAAEDEPPSFGNSHLPAEKDNIRLMSDRAYQSSKNARVGGPALAAPPPGQQAPSTNPAPTPTAPPARVPPAAVPATPPPKAAKKPDMKSVGQLGVRASPKMKTITLYDGKEARKKNRENYTADAAALEQAARTYASDGTWAIDISQEGWQDKLKAILAAEEHPAKGGKGGIDRIMIFDHGWPGSQEFGNDNLTPESEDWKTISSAIKPHGDIVFMGCNVSAQEDDIITGEYLDGKAYVDSFYLASGRRRPVIRAYDGKVRHAEDKLHLSTTPGGEYATPSQ